MPGFGPMRNHRGRQPSLPYRQADGIRNFLPGFSEHLQRQGNPFLSAAHRQAEVAEANRREQEELAAALHASEHEAKRREQQEAEQEQQAADRRAAVARTREAEELRRLNSRAAELLDKCVDIIRVTHRPRLNGQRGTAMSWDKERQRMKVQLVNTGERHQIRLDNLQIVANTSAHTSSQDSAARDALLWARMAEGVRSVEEVHRFFARQQDSPGAPGKLTIARASKVINEQALRRFVSAGDFNADPLQAHRAGSDSLLFHGCPEQSVANIQADGLSLKFAAAGMLGSGLYGAPDPRKSKTYCRNSPNGQFMFICRYNLQGAEHAGPSTSHRNTVFDEFCVKEEEKVVVLWCLKVQ